ncbi:MAG: hypothetical protein COW10_02355 [Candidatus Omnitrophica bacterium CG12_big_fil_rev_8_21_14_0_65_42_8]|nr:MAG: hypothetical protein COW10_02355 [Candidatus Omnitrophica bacterium CG12_big_fil_rev_8_21_14_0_65_42_8]
MMEKLGVPNDRIRYLTVPIKWNNMGIQYPEELKKLAEDIGGITIYHEALEVDFEGKGNWVTLDATWDLPLKGGHGFMVNTCWDGVSGTELGVIKSNDGKIIRHATMEERDVYFNSEIEKLAIADREKLANFYNAFDKWLEKLRGYDKIGEFLREYFPNEGRCA